MRKRHQFWFCLIAITSCFLSGCTGNILDHQSISPPPDQITGTVELSNGQNVEGIYVWLEGLNIGQRTNENGEFNIEIPSFALQEDRGGLTGIFNLYYYSANFNLESTELVFSNGSLASRGVETRRNGDLLPPQVVLQNLRIETLVAPRSVSAAEVVRAELRREFIVVICKVTLQALLNPLTIEFPTRVDDLLSPVIFRNVDTDEFFVIQSKIAGLSFDNVLTLRDEPVSRFLVIELQSRHLPKGEYEVIPYVLLDQQLPDGLLESLGPNVQELGPDYLKLPILRETSRFTLLD